MAGPGGHTHAGGSETLQWVVELKRTVMDELDEKVGGEDLGERAEAEDGFFVGEFAGTGSGFTVALEEDFFAANDNQHHAGGAGAGEEIGAEGAGLRERWERLCRWRYLRGERQRQEEQC